jgi:hypothetical protein
MGVGKLRRGEVVLEVKHPGCRFGLSAGARSINTKVEEASRQADASTTGRYAYGMFHRS